MYSRISNNVFFLLPTIAVGLHTDAKYFIEFGWFCFAIGVGK